MHLRVAWVYIRGEVNIPDYTFQMFTINRLTDKWLMEISTMF